MCEEGGCPNPLFSSKVSLRFFAAIVRVVSELHTLYPIPSYLVKALLPAWNSVAEGKSRPFALLGVGAYLKSAAVTVEIFRLPQHRVASPALFSEFLCGIECKQNDDVFHRSLPQHCVFSSICD